MHPGNAEQSVSDRKLVFISYSHRDSSLKDELSLHLGVLQREGLIEAWNDVRIEAGRDWALEIDAAIDATKVAVLLVSAHFLTSRFILREEIPRLLQGLTEGKLRIMPVILEACLWKSVPWLAALQTRPRSGRPLNAQSDSARAQEWTDICEEIIGWLDAMVPSPPPKLRSTLREASGAIFESSDGGRTDGLGPSATAAVTSQTAGNTVRQFADAAAENPHAERVLASFKAEFSSASKAIEALTDYKEMHDELHNFEFQCLPRLLTAQNMTTDAAQEELERCVFDLEATINHLRAVEDRSNLRPDKTSWINTLVQALELLQTARDRKIATDARKACTLLNRVLNTEPSRINDRMCQIAEQLDLGPLSRALTYAEARIQQSSLDAGKLSELEAGIRSLKVLQTAMHDLVGEHDAWQRLETDLRLIEHSLPRGLEELELLWPEIERNVKERVKSHPEAWAAQLSREVSDVADALSSSEANGPLVIPRFRMFRRRAGQRFFQVDSNLRDSFGKIANVGEPLLLLLRTIEQ